ncbi:unnamed protein product [Bacillus phage SPP1]|uniref:Bacteriophage SPP1 complete nucleotide sequence n=1 Tax=Bacillus phage SPP1 TaxID=10724 RepID=O48452_BPSPP|nr:hypothetical protein SPP1p030 [Bacillus phage SPP1]CAA66553.1 unnamed protein product [Bacillus phage SPP1]
MTVNCVSGWIPVNVCDVVVTFASNFFSAPLYTLYESAPSTASHFTVTLSVVAVYVRFWGALGSGNSSRCFTCSLSRLLEVVTAFRYINDLFWQCVDLPVFKLSNNLKGNRDFHSSLDSVAVLAAFDISKTKLCIIFVIFIFHSVNTPKFNLLSVLVSVLDSFLACIAAFPIVSNLSRISDRTRT